jgi:hypothetical protein
MARDRGRPARHVIEIHGQTDRLVPFGRNRPRPGVGGVDIGPATRQMLWRRGLALEYALGIIWLAFTALAMFALAAGKRGTGKLLGNPVLGTEARVTTAD